MRPWRARRGAQADIRERTAVLVAATVLAFCLLGGRSARAWQTGVEATVPKPDKVAQEFTLDAARGRIHSFRDGDPSVEDAPIVIAVAGGAQVWYGETYVTAKNLLLWVDAETLEGAAAEEEAGLPFGTAAPIDTTEPAEDGAAFARLSDPQGVPNRRTSGRLREIYAEGDVYMKQGPNKVFQAEKVYINILEDRQLVIRGELRTNLSGLSTLSADALAGGEVDAPKPDEASAPIVIRAAEIRGVSQGLWEADNAQLTTSTLGKPGYHIAMEKLEYEELVQELGGRVTGTDNRFVLGDVPLLSLPYFTLRTGVQSPLPLIGFSAGFSSKFGLFARTRWGNVFEETGTQINEKLGVEGSFTGNWFADVDLYTFRGLGLGAGVEYETKDGGKRKYFGSTQFYFLHDSGNDYTANDEEEDSDEDEDSPTGPRGRFKSQNRMFLPDGWQLDTEFNYVSDRGFLREFFPDEYSEEKEPETLAYVKKLDGDTGVTALAKYRLNDWQTQTQYLPQATYDVISRPIAEFGRFDDPLDRMEPRRLYWTHRSEAAFVGYRPSVNKDGDDDDNADTLRVDDIERLNLPFEIGNVGVDPYFENRLTMWAGEGEEDGGGALREAMTVGFNASTQYWRTDPDFESEFWNIHGLRHIVIPALRYRWTFFSTVASDDLVPYDSVEFFDTLHALVPGVRNRYQTKRRTRFGLETVEFLDVDVQQPLVFENGRDEDQDVLGDLWVDARWRPDLDYYLLRDSRFRSSLAWNWNDAALDLFRFEFQSEPGPDFYTRVAYSWSRRGRVSPTLAFEGFTKAKPKDDEALSSLTFEVAYQATRLWEFVVLKQFDFGGGSGGETALLLRRATHDWMFEFGVGAPSSGIGTGVGFSVTPMAFFKRSERDRFQSAIADGYDLTPIFDEPEYSAGTAYDGTSGEGP